MKVNDAIKLIDEELDIKWSFEDFFYIYCESLGIDALNIESEEEYDRLERECASLIDRGLIRGIRETMTQYGNEIIADAMYQ